MGYQEQDIAKNFIKSMETFCKYCGKLLLMTNTNEKGETIDWQVEHATKACTSCYNKAAAIERQRVEKLVAEQAILTAVPKGISEDAINEALKNMPKPEAG